MTEDRSVSSKDQELDGDDVIAEKIEVSIERRPSAHPLDLPRLIGGVISDIRQIAEGMAVLPRLLTTLNTIEERVESLDAEVKLMRAGVDGMGGDVTDLTKTMERLEPHLEDVSRVAHPLRRLNERTRRRPPGPER